VGDRSLEGQTVAWGYSGWRAQNGGCDVGKSSGEEEMSTTLSGREISGRKGTEWGDVAVGEGIHE
jgi:hypothetical protein